MKKYLFIFKSELMSSLQYVMNIFITFIGYFIIMFIFLQLWKYIYNDPKEIINGYTMNQMIWYVTITEILWYVSAGRRYSKRIIEDVKGGNIAYNISKPYNYILYSLSSHLGTRLISGLLYSCFGLIIGYIFLGSFPNITIIGIMATIISGILAITINTLLITFIGLFSFIIEDANPFYWLYSKAILVLGTTFPIEYFPKLLQTIIKYSPIYVVTYGPAKLFVDFSWNSFIHIITTDIIYIIVSYILCTLVYKKGVKKLNVNGG